MIQPMYHLKSKQEIGLKQMINHKQHKMPIVTLNLKPH